MIKFTCLFICLTLLMVSNTAHAQSYTITSMEGATAKIKLSRRKGWRDLLISTGINWRALYISTGTDSIVLNDCNQIKAVHVLNGKFLEIAYFGRGGTGFRGGSVMILCVNKHKLNVALVVDAFASSFAPAMDNIPYNERYYKTTFHLSGGNKSNYRLHLNATERQISTPRSRDDYNRHSQLVLNFDPGQHIFYSARKPIDHVFSLEDTDKIHLKGLLPMIVLADENYYYFKCKWYKPGISNELFTEY